MRWAPRPARSCPPATREFIENTPVTLVDYAMPRVLRASDLGLSGDETPDELEANLDLLARLEAIRLEAGVRMGLGDVSGSVVPKVGILSGARHGGTITSRYFMNCNAATRATRSRAPCASRPPAACPAASRTTSLPA